VDNPVAQQSVAEPVELKVLDALFNRAKETDEFEYVCALLRIRGAEDSGWDPLEESRRAINDYSSLIEAPLRSDTKLRLALLVYCHIIESDAIYEVIENMLNITNGDRCNISPLAHLYIKRQKAGVFQSSIPPSAKKVVDHLKEHAANRGEVQLANLLGDMVDEKVRNAFFHSDYIIYKDEFRIRHGGFPDARKVSELENIINRALLFFQSFLYAWTQHKLTYKAAKIVKGRIGHQNALVDVELLVHPTAGVYGFRTPPGEPPAPPAAVGT
jgi:hypothetical protein